MDAIVGALATALARTEAAAVLTGTAAGLSTSERDELEARTEAVVAQLRGLSAYASRLRNRQLRPAAGVSRRHVLIWPKHLVSGNRPVATARFRCS
jgi:hypothetical protein